MFLAVLRPAAIYRFRFIMGNYLVQWSYLSGGSGQAFQDDRLQADRLARYHAHRWGGSACVVRTSDLITVYRVVNIKEENAHAA